MPVAKSSRKLLAAFLVLGAAIPSWAAEQGKAGQGADGSPASTVATPNFAGVWARAWKQSQLFDPPESGPGPIVVDPNWVRKPGGNNNQPWVADSSNPILQPATRKKLKAIGDGEIAGSPLLKGDTLCLPLGIPAALNLFDTMQILQSPTEVVFLYARDHQARVVRLNEKHAKKAAQSWFGDSVGHYEGDTLVIDTIGMNDKTLMDRYGTPHSDKLHIIERYRMSDDGKLINVSLTFEDPVAFTAPWGARVNYGRDPSRPFEEIVCAENNRSVGEGNTALPIPVAERPDF